MTPRTAIARIAKTIGRELEADAGPSEGGWTAGSMLAEAGATKDIAACLLAEARRKRPDDRVINGCAFLLERALDTLRLARNGGDVGAGRAIDEVREAIGHVKGSGARPAWAGPPLPATPRWPSSLPAARSRLPAAVDLLDRPGDGDADVAHGLDGHAASLRCSLRPARVRPRPRRRPRAPGRCPVHHAGHAHDRTQAVLFTNKLMPWDHAAGWLLHRDAEGHGAHFDGSAYRPTHLAGGLICAPDAASWRLARDALLGRAGHPS